MQQQQEKLWDYAAVEAGQAGTATVVELTAAHIERYAETAQCPDPRFKQDRAHDENTGALVAMPTMVLTYAPLLRDNIAEANGFVALEQSKTARRQTPFAKCEIRWHKPAHAGDTITATRRVLEKYERRGSKFVTFRVEAVNQHGQPVAEYDYTCIFEYAQGQRQVPQGRGPAEGGSAEPSQTSSSKNGPGEAKSRLISYEGIALGDRLVPLTVSESQEIINRRNDFRLAGNPSESNIHTDEEFARQNIFGGTTNSGPATMSYIDQMLSLSFPLQAFYQGGSLLMRAIEPFRAGDTVTFEGEVTGKREEAGKKLIECRVKGINQRGDLVSLADGVMVMG